MTKNMKHRNEKEMGLSRGASQNPPDIEANCTIAKIEFRTKAIFTTAGLST